MTRGKLRCICVWLAVLGLCATTLPAGADFTYGSIMDSSNFTFRNSLHVNNRLRVMQDGVLGTASAVWYNFQQEIGGGFTTTFQYQMDWSGTPGDGFAFVINASPAGTAALGVSGGGIGYAGITNSMAIEFDTYCSSTEQTLGQHIAVQTEGAAGNNSSHNLAGPTKGAVAQTFDKAVHTVKVVYTPGSPGTIDVYHDNMTTPALTVNYDLASIGYYNGPVNPRLSAPHNMVGWRTSNPNIDIEWSGAAQCSAGAVLGFTGGTGGASQTADILSWSVTAASQPTPGAYGYSYLLDMTPGTTPDTTVDMTHTADPHAQTYATAVDGVYYFHLRTRDAAGTWCSAVHLGPFIIDSTAANGLPALASAGLAMLGAALAAMGLRRLRR